MYIQITTRCNMHCRHCAASCTADGVDMSLDTFRKALKLTNDLEEDIFIGGGEPTVHPLFPQFLMEAIGHGAVGIITNGKIKDRALLIARLTRRGLVEGFLSRDIWHERIDKEVVLAFADRYHTVPRRNLTGYGRALMLPDASVQFGCFGRDFSVDPWGDVHQCGCPGSPEVGSVDAGIDPWWVYENRGLCYRDPAYEPFVA